MLYSFPILPTRHTNTKRLQLRLIVLVQLQYTHAHLSSYVLQKVSVAHFLDWTNVECPRGAQMCPPATYIVYLFSSVMFLPHPRPNSVATLNSYEERSSPPPPVRYYVLLGSATCAQHVARNALPGELYKYRQSFKSGFKLKNNTFLGRAGGSCGVVS